MIKKDNFDNRYNYYFYGINDIDEIDKCFTDGLKIPDRNFLGNGASLFNSMVNSYGLNNCLEYYAKENNYKYVFVFKIPSYYMGWVHRNGDVEFFVPLFLTVNNKSTKVKETYIISELINGVYIKNKEEFILNENYNALYDPTGLQYSDEQLCNMYKFGYYDLASKEVRRNVSTYNDLKRDDELNHKWERIVEYYNSSKVKRLFSKVKRKVFNKR